MLLRIGLYCAKNLGLKFLDFFLCFSVIPMCFGYLIEAAWMSGGKLAVGRFISIFTCCKLCEQAADLKCSACDVARYCSKEHQTRDWKAHKPLCKWLRDELFKRPLTQTTSEAKLLRKQQMAAVYWERLAGEGDAEAQFNLGNCYHWKLQTNTSYTPVIHQLYTENNHTPVIHQLYIFCV